MLCAQQKTGSRNPRQDAHHALLAAIEYHQLMMCDNVLDFTLPGSDRMCHVLLGGGKAEMDCCAHSRPRARGAWNRVVLGLQRRPGAARSSISGRWLRQLCGSRDALCRLGSLLGSGHYLRRELFLLAHGVGWGLLFSALVGRASRRARCPI